MKKSLLATAILFLGLSMTISTAAFAIPFGFSDIPDPGTIDISSNFLGDISNYGGGQILFKFSNNGPITSFIRQVFFEYDPDSLLTNGAFSSVNSTGIVALGGVNFVFDSPVNNPPQGNAISFIADLEAIADKPGSGKQGADVGETAAFLFYGDFSNVLSALNNGSLRIALHVQGIAPEGGSDSYVNNPVPEPISMLLFGTGLVGIGGYVRRKLKK